MRVNGGRDTGARGRSPILIIDDERLMLELYRRIMGRARPITAEQNPQRDIERLASREPFDGVISDVVMGPPGGAQVYQVVMGQRPS